MLPDKHPVALEVLVSFSQENPPNIRIEGTIGIIARRLPREIECL